MNIVLKQKLRQKRRWRIRKKVKGTPERPRLSLCLSNKHIYAQCIDDEAGHTVLFVSSRSKDLRDQKLAANLQGAAALGKVCGERARTAGISSVVFDRSGRRYHGAVKVFADSVRSAGIEF